MLNAGFSTLVYLKSRLLPDAGIEETQWDTALGKLGLAVAARFNAHCNRDLDRLEDTTYFASARTMSVTLRRFPVESITSVEVIATDGTTTALEETGYTLDTASGVLEFLTPPGDRTDRLKVTYTGGFWLDPLTGATLPTGATALPDDLLEAWVSEVQIQAESRNLFGAISLRKDSTKSKPSTGLDESTVEALRPHRRFSGE